MKTSLQCFALASAVLFAFTGSGCKKAEPEKPSTVSTVAKEKHTKTKAHKRDKKKEKEKEKEAGGKKAKPQSPATPEPAKPAE